MSCLHSEKSNKKSDSCKFYAVSFIFLCLSILFCSSCSIGGYVYKASDEFVESGNFASAQVALQPKAKEYGKKNSILYHLDYGMLSHYAGDYEASIENLSVAENFIKLAYTKSITENIGSFLLNDNTVSYPGEDYEDIYINVFKALDYYKLGKKDSAMVEIRKIDGKLRLLITKYSQYKESVSKDISSNQEMLNSVGYKVERKSSQFSESALARYLSLIFYRGQGMLDDARIDRNAISSAFKSQPTIYPFAQPKTLDDELKVTSKTARLNIVAFTGRSPIKHECSVRIPFDDTYAKIVWPEFKQIPSVIDYVEVVFEDGTKQRLDLIEDMSAVAVDTFNVKSSAVFMKALIRGLTKAITTSVVAQESRKKDRDTAVGLSVFGTLFNEISEQADTRSSRYFPAKAYVLGVNLEQGKYNFEVCYMNKSGNCIWSEEFKEVPVLAGTLNLEESICLR